MKSFFSAIFLSALLLTLLAGCSYQSTTTNAPGQNVGTKPQQGCPEAMLSQEKPQPENIHYAVSWDANPASADSGQGTSTLHVSALNVATGHILWQCEPTTISALYQSSMQQVVDGVLYIAASDLHSSLLLAVDTKDGHKLWQYEEKQASIVSMNILKGKVYLCIGNAKLKALQATNGQLLWTYTHKALEISSDVLATAQAIYLVEPEASQNGQERRFVTALEPDSGKVLWSNPYQGEAEITTLRVIATSQGVLVLNHNSIGFKLQALQPETGKVVWTFPLPGPQDFSILASDDTVYLNGQSYRDTHKMLLVALDARNGKRLWQREDSYSQITLLPGQGLYAYKGYSGFDFSPKKTFCLLDSATGQDRWCVDTLHPSLFSLSETKDALIVVDDVQPGLLSLSHNIYALSKQDGRILWKLPWKSSSPSVTTLTLVTVATNQS